jgi:hypothetical protein
MNYKSITSLLLLIPLLLGGVSTSQTAAGSPDIAPAASVKPDELLYVSAISMAGTMWQPQRDAQFNQWVVYGWGTAVKSSIAGNRWVHIGVPNVYFLENQFKSISTVEFCARSSSGNRTKPTQMDVWSYGTQISTQSISWANNNNIQCISHTYSPRVYYRDVSISVSLHFANTTDEITLYRAEVVIGNDQ